MSQRGERKQSPLFHLTAGACAGFVESSICHPLDTIKTRMQLQTNHCKDIPHPKTMKLPTLRLRQPHIAERAWCLQPITTACFTTTTTATSHSALPRMGPLGTARHIVHTEGFWALYKGLSAVQTGVVQKMAVRYTSFEQYRDGLEHLVAGTNIRVSPSAIHFVAGLGAGITEAAFITPTEVCKVRMMTVVVPSSSSSSTSTRPTQQACHLSNNNNINNNNNKYANLLQTATTIIREEGIGALYKGVAPTMLRNGTNQAVNFTAYNAAKKQVMDWQETDTLAPWQSLMIGGITGGMGPVVTNPLDVVKTRLQKQVVAAGSTPKYNGVFPSIMVIYKEEGSMALWKGITPRLMRMMPGQAITFMTYEAVSAQMKRLGMFQN